MLSFVYQFILVKILNFNLQSISGIKVKCSHLTNSVMVKIKYMLSFVYQFVLVKILKGELRPEISLLHMKVLTLIKAKKYWRLGRRHLGLSSTLWRHIARIKEKIFSFALIKVSTFICKREISGLSSALILTCSQFQELK